MVNYRRGKNRANASNVRAYLAHTEEIDKDDASSVPRSCDVLDELSRVVEHRLEPNTKHGMSAMSRSEIHVQYLQRVVEVVADRLQPNGEEVLMYRRNSAKHRLTWSGASCGTSHASTRGRTSPAGGTGGSA